jgi:hypothetical protein
MAAAIATALRAGGYGSRPGDFKPEQGSTEVGRAVRTTRRILIRSERHSGSAWLIETLIRNIVMPDLVVWDDQMRGNAGNGAINLGWKHALCFPCPGTGEILPDDIGFVIVRDSVSWIPRMMLETYEPSQKNYKLEKAFHGIVRKLVPEFLREQWFEQYSGANYDNILDMRAKKYRHWMTVAETHPNVQIVRYEDMATDHGKGLLAQLCKANPTLTCTSNFVPVLEHVKFNEIGAPYQDGRSGRGQNHVEQPASWSAGDMRALLSGLDMTLERKLGYFETGDDASGKVGE